MPDRFYLPGLAAGAVALDGPEAHHLIHVLRAKPGLRVTLFSSDGREAAATVAQIERTVVRLDAEPPLEVDRELTKRVTVAVALPKGDRQRWLVEKLTELGAARLVPLLTARGVAQPAGEALRRCERTVIEASKQCGRNRLMEIAGPQNAVDFFQQTQADVRLLAHVGAAIEIAGQSPRELTAAIAIGPEGGFTDQEAAEAIAAGWSTISLGRAILRTETAALALMAHLAMTV